MVCSSMSGHRYVGVDIDGIHVRWIVMFSYCSVGIDVILISVRLIADLSCCHMCGSIASASLLDWLLLSSLDVESTWCRNQY